MDYKLILTGLLVNAYKLTDGEVAELLNENGENTDDTEILTVLLDKDKARISKFSKADPQGKAKFQEGYKKGKAESLTAFENLLKDTYAIDSDLTGAELVAEIITSNSGDGSGTLTDDAVKKHPLFLNEQRAKNKAVSDKEAEWKAKYQDLESSHNKAKTFSIIESRAGVLLDSMNPILPTNANVAANQRKWYIEQFKNYDYQIDGDNITILDKEGNPAQDDHGNNIDFSALGTQIASEFFDFKKNPGGNNSNNTNADDKNKNKNKNGLPAGVQMPKTFEEYSNIMNDRSILPKDRLAIADAWQAAQGKE